MKRFDFSRGKAEAITRFESSGVSSVALGHGTGASHAYCLYYEPGGVIGEHPTGFCQLFLVLQGTAWVAGEDGERLNLTAGQGAFFESGELHSKGSDTGAVVIMMQADEMGLAAAEPVAKN